MKRSLSISLLCFVAGCARFEHQPLSPAETAGKLDSRSLDNPALKSFLEQNLHRAFTEWPAVSWDSERLTLAAFFYHPSLDVARAQWAVAQAGKTTAGERPNPTLSLTPGYDTTTFTPSPWLPLGFLDIPLETAGKRGYRIAQAGRLSEAARLNIASVAWQVRSGVRKSLVQLNAAREAEALLREQQALQAENLRLLEGQYQAGAVSAFEVAQAGIASDSTRLALRDAEWQSAEARVALAGAIGVPVGALESIRLSLEDLGRLPEVAALADARRQALLTRPDILGALAEYAASQSALQLEIAKQFPDVHLGPGYQYNQGDNQWLLAITVTLPVFNQNQGPIAEAKAKRAEAAARFDALQAGVLSEIDRAVAGYRAALKKRADADALLARLKKQEQRSSAMFDAGEISKGELAALRLQLSASALARLEALVKSQQALVQLEDALQGPLGLPEAVWQTSPRVSQSNQVNAQP
ncbi:MAG: TolC family protein [Verrucomicrobiota bacterium]|jgi:outer membrane protein TolC